MKEVNLLAEMSGIDPWEFRRRNAIKPGDVLPNGQTADHIPLTRHLPSPACVFFSLSFT